MSCSLAFDAEPFEEFENEEYGKFPKEHQIPPKPSNAVNVGCPTVKRSTKYRFSNSHLAFSCKFTSLFSHRPQVPSHRPLRPSQRPQQAPKRNEIQLIDLKDACTQGEAKSIPNVEVAADPGYRAKTLYFQEKNVIMPIYCILGHSHVSARPTFTNIQSIWPN